MILPVLDNVQETCVCVCVCCVCVCVYSTECLGGEDKRDVLIDDANG